MAYSRWILDQAIRCGLTVKIDQVVPMDGNSWYQSVVQQLKRPTISSYITEHGRSELLEMDHYQLRVEICNNVNDFIKMSPSAYVNEFLQRKDISWEQHFVDQSSCNNPVSDLFIRATAWQVGLNICINSLKSTLICPYDVWRPYMPEPGISYTELDREIDRRPYIMIGQFNVMNVDHFQSLLPNDMNIILNIDNEWHKSTKRQKMSSPDDFQCIPQPAKCRKDEEEIREKLLACNLQYEAPSTDETADERKNRFKRMNRILAKYERQRNKEMEEEEEIKEKLHACNLDYETPPSEETAEERKKRIRRMRYHLSKYEKQHKEPIVDSADNGSIEIDMGVNHFIDPAVVTLMSNMVAHVAKEMKNIDRRRKTDNEYKEKLLARNLPFESPPTEETERERTNRIRRMRYALDNYEEQHREPIVDNADSASIEIDIGDDEIVDPTAVPVDPAVEEIREENKAQIHSNPKVVEAVLQFEKGEMEHKIARCRTCLNVRPVFHSMKCGKERGQGIPTPPSVNPWKIDKNGRCSYCKVRPRNNRAATFSGIFSKNDDISTNPEDIMKHNDMHFREIPPYLKDLSAVETALISKITVITKVHVLKTGMLSGRGHTISLPHPMSIATELPLLPTDINIIVLKRAGDNPRGKHYLVDRKRVEDALKGLCYGYPHGGLEFPEGECKELYTHDDHIHMPLNGRYFQFIPNPYYHDVEIMQDNLELLPETRSQLPQLKVVERENVYENNPPPLNPEEEPLDLTHSGLIQPLQPENADENIRTLLKKLVGDEVDVDAALQNSTIGFGNMQRNPGDPVRELNTKGFFSMAYPTIFISGSCDYTIPRAASKEMTYARWVEHIYFCQDNRVSSHPYLKFFLLNMQMRKQCLQQGMFCVKQQLQDAHLTIEKLLENLNNNDDSVPRKIISMAKNLVNTHPYWKLENKKVDAFTVFHKKEYGDIVSGFQTNSCAEFHWVPLHELLIKYTVEISDDDEPTVRNKFLTDRNYRYDMIMKNNHIVTHYFDTRVLNYMNSIGVHLYDFCDYWFRYEFAAGRGMIHSHGIIFSLSHHEKIRDALDSFPTESQGDGNCVAEELEKVLQSTDYNDDTFFSPGYVSMHPAGGNAVDTEDGLAEWIPDKSKWPAPEGSANPPLENPLTKNVIDVIDVPDGINDLHLNICNKVGLHKCTSYCLKLKRNEDVEVNPPQKYCRFHYGDYDNATKKSSGKELHPSHPLVTKGEHPRYEGKSDHPRFIQHIKTRMLTWKGNCDDQVIIEQFLLALQNYLTKYVCKGAASTSDFIQVYRLLLENSNDSTTVKSICQRLLLKIVGCVDMPEAAVDYINTGGKLVHSTRNYNQIGISGYRSVNTSGNGENLTNNSLLDKFKSEERRSRDPSISLYDWAKKCGSVGRCNCNCLHVPVFTGAMIRPVWPLTEDYSKATLICYARGDWNEVEDLKNGQESYVDALLLFLDSPDSGCPQHIKDMLLEAKGKYDRNNAAQRQPTNNDALLNSQPQSQDSIFSSQSSYDGVPRMRFRDAIYNDALLGRNVPDPYLERQLHTVAEDFDWFQYGLDCVGDILLPENGETWVANVSEIAREEFIEYNDEFDPVEVNILLANHLQRVAISMVVKQLLKAKRGEDPEQLLMLLAGTAGTGKTFVIRCNSRVARRLFNRNGAVLNLAPTGAAATLLPDGRTMHSVTTIPRNTKRDVQITDHPLGNEARRYLSRITGTKDARLAFLLNQDERGMTSHDVAAWNEYRFREATLDYDTTYGNIPVVCWTGDHGQLGPVRKPDLLLPPKPGASPVQRSGYVLYRQFTKVIYLNETMRQGPDQIELLETLLRIRNGTIEQKDWLAIINRYEGDLTAAEKLQFTENNTITLCETWADAEAESSTILSKFEIIASFPSDNVGTHVTGQYANKLNSQVPLKAILAVGMRVVLLKNQGGLAPYGLNNGALGTVVAIIFEPGVQPPKFPKYVIVDFPKYRGQPWCEEKPTWIPIAPQIGKCEKMCCDRMGLPLLPAYAITIAKAQGSTIGENELVTHMRLKLQNTTQFETGAPGTAYTGLSRVDRNSSWTLVDPIDFRRLEVINNHSTIRSRREEDERLLNLHRETLAEHDISKRDFLELLREVDRESPDDITDALCTSNDENCRCIACTVEDS